MLQLYDHLLQFSLFQGMSRDDLELVAGHTRFAFSKTLAGKRIVSTGQPCQQLIFLRRCSTFTGTCQRTDDNLPAFR